MIKIIIKNQIINKNFIYIIIFMIALSFIITSNLFSQDKILKIAISDLDDTKSSFEIVNSISNIDKVELIEVGENEDAYNNIASGKYIIHYDIKEGFEDNLKKGNINSLIRTKSRENTKETSILNDKVSLEVLKMYIENENFARTKIINPRISYEEYRDTLEKNREKNTILSLNVENINRNIKFSHDDRAIYRVIPVFTANIISLMMFTRFAKLKKDKIFKRLLLIGNSKYKIYISYFTSYIIKLSIIAVISFLILGINFYSVLLFLINAILVYLIYFIMERLTPNYDIFIFSSKILFFILIIILYLYYYLKYVIL